MNIIGWMFVAVVIFAVVMVCRSIAAPDVQRRHIDTCTCLTAREPYDDNVSINGYGADMDTQRDVRNRQIANWMYTRDDTGESNKDRMNEAYQTLLHNLAGHDLKPDALGKRHEVMAEYNRKFGRR